MKLHRSSSGTRSNANGQCVTFRDGFCFAMGVLLTLCTSQYVAMSNHLWDATLLSDTATINTATITGPFTTTTSSITTALDARVSAQDEQGFHPLHIYYGKNDLIHEEIPADRFWTPAEKGQLPGNRLWFSQHGQDVAVMQALDYWQNKPGFFVDLAANDAVWASNTYTLEQHFDWRGICIEANPIYWHKLAYRHCHAVGAIVGNAKAPNEVLPVHLSADRIKAPLGGIVGDQFDNKKPQKGEKVLRYTVPLATILERFQAPKVIDYLSLDVEGAEWFIMGNFDFDKYQFQVLTIERPSEELQILLGSHGYRKIYDIARGDTLWAHASIADAAADRVKQRPQDIKAHKTPELSADSLPHSS
eukprot:scaffold278_cov195-Amphora_coffeaeformis.AAC.16